MNLLYSGKLHEYRLKMKGIVMNSVTLNERARQLYSRCSETLLTETVHALSAFHRIQVTDGYHLAAQEAASRLSRAGLLADVCAYPANLQTTYLTQRMFRGWRCSEGWLEITAPFCERAADYRMEEMSLIQRSASLDAAERELPIVYAAADVDPQTFCEDLSGCLLFAESRFSDWTERAAELGACGIITCSIPEIPPVRVALADDPQLKDAHGNLSFHVFTEAQEGALAGFNIAPACARRLREACLALAQTHARPMARACVRSEFYDSAVENVMAYIPGLTEEEVLVTAHLCHPRSSVNDNISGVACTMEAMRVLHEQIACGALPTPRRGIRLLLIPEFTGTYAYLASEPERAARTVAAINADMVGARQDGRTGPVILVDTPDAAHAFLGDLMECVMDGIAQECPFGSGFVPLYMQKRVPFTSGSDHEIFSDPSIGIPSIAMTQWPDRTYHTSADDAAHLDPAILRRVAAMIAAGAYTAASFCRRDAEQILPYTARRFFARADALRRSGAENSAAAKYFLLETWRRTLQDMQRALPPQEQAEAESLLAPEYALAAQMLPDAEAPGEAQEPSLRRIPKRLFRAPLSMRPFEAGLSGAQRAELSRLQREFAAQMGLTNRILYAVDGRHSIHWVASFVEAETGVCCERFCEAWLELLAQAGLVEF